LEYGSFTIIGIDRSPSRPKKGRAYVLKCKCGIYTSRSTKAVRKGLGKLTLKDDCCDRCADLDRLRRQQEFTATGKNDDSKKTYEQLEIMLKVITKKHEANCIKSESLSVQLKEFESKVMKQKREINRLLKYVGAIDA
jgi:seryl-tRNA synthetase